MLAWGVALNGIQKISAYEKVIPRELTVRHAFTTCLSDIRVCVSLKVIVWIRGLIKENTCMGKQD